MLHPAIKISCLVLFALSFYQLSLIELTLLALCLLICLIYYRVKQFLPMIKRMRWLLLSMFLIYAFSTPGEFLKDWPIDIAPTYEGIDGGLIQSLRLSMMLAAVALLISTTSRQSMILGFYCLLQPLRYLGFMPAKFAARLSLTLHYIELNNQLDTQATQFNKHEMIWQRLMRLDQQALDSSEQDQMITLDGQSLSLYDYLVILILLMLITVKWLN